LLKKLKWIPLILLLLFACNGFQPKEEIYEPDYKPQVVVFSLISPDKGYNYAIVERTLSLKEYDRISYGGNSASSIIKDAVVKIIHDRDAVQLSFHQSQSSDDEDYYYSDYFRRGIYLDKKNELVVKPGEIYRLRVELADGKVITGTTRVPKRPEIISPANYEHVSKYHPDQIVINWSDDAETAAYQMYFYLTWKSQYYAFRSNVLGNYIVTKPPVTPSEVLTERLANPYESYSDTATVKVMAMDRNYYDYKRSNSGFAGMSASTFNLLHGGLGAFGSASLDSVNIVLE